MADRNFRREEVNEVIEPTLSAAPWLVWKFGGTSVANAKRLVAVANLICKRSKIPCDGNAKDSQSDVRTFQSSKSSTSSASLSSSSHSVSNLELSSQGVEYRLAVVVSAMAGITNALQACCTAASREFYRPHQRPSSGPEQLEYCRKLEEIKSHHFIVVDELLAQGELDQKFADTFKATHAKDISNISEILRAFLLSGTSPMSLVEMVMGHGELWSSRLLFGVVKKRKAAMMRNLRRSREEDTEDESQGDDQQMNGDCETAALHKSRGCNFCSPCSVHGFAKCQCCRSKTVRWIDARQILVLDDSNSSGGGVYEKVTLDFNTSNINMKNWCCLHPQCEIVFITGYICSTKFGTPATLKRNGSDYSGSLFTKLLKAKLYTVWTDIDGVYTADPAKVPTAFRLPFLSYIEAIELAYFGAKILHPLTMGPCISANIPIIIRSSLDPESPGTLIGRSLPESPAPSTPKHGYSPDQTGNLLEPVMKGNLLSPSSLALTKLNSVDKKKALFGFCKAFTLIDNIALINVTGTSMIGVPGIGSRLFAAVHQANCSVAMISQASSEHSICFAVLSNQADKGKAAVEEAFYKEISHDRSMKVSVAKNCTIICAVGERMCGALGVLSRLATALANAEVNVKAVAQGASEFNITFVVDTEAANRAICAMHNAIYDLEFLNTAAQCRDSLVKWNESTVMSTVREETSCFSVPRLLTTKDKFIRVLFLVHSLPVPHPLRRKILQIASDIHRRAIDPTPLERQGLPVCIVGYTDSVIYVKKLQTNSKQPQASILPASSANDFLADEDNQKLFVLFDLRMLRIRESELSSISTPNSPLSSSSPTPTDDLLRHQSHFVQQWKGSGRIVIDSSRTIQVAPVLESIRRMVTISFCNVNDLDASYFDHVETTTNDDSSSLISSEDADSTHNSSSQFVSDASDDQRARHSSATRNLGNRRCSFTAEDIEL